MGDNGSTDDTAQVLEEFAEVLPLRSFREATPGKNRVLNRAIQDATGKFWIFTDDDVLPSSDWLHAYLRAAAEYPDDDVFGGRIDLDFPDGTPGWIRDIGEPERCFAFSSFVLEQATGPMDRSPNGPNMAIRATVFNTYRYNEDIGPAGKNYAMGSESELLHRLKEAGLRFIYVADAGVEHIIRPEQTSLEWLAGRAFRLGRGQYAGSLRAGTARSQIPKSLAQMAYVFPSYALNTLSEDRKRFWSLWHMQKSLGRLYEWRSRRR